MGVWIRSAWTVGVAGLTVSFPAPAAPFFQGLGDLSGGMFRSAAQALSADGSVVVGESESTSGPQAFRWTQGGGMVGLGDLPGAQFRSFAYDVSDDGSVVSGFSFSTASGSFPEAFRWTQAGGMVGLGDVAGGFFWSVGYCVSGDGATVAGLVSTGTNALEAMRWTQAGGMVAFGDLPGGAVSAIVRGAGATGGVLVGRGAIDSSGGNPQGEAFRWTTGGGFQSLGDLAGGLIESSAAACTPDGGVIVGYATTGSGANARQAMRWTQASGMIGLGDLPAGAMSSEALAVSADGLTVVGYGSTDLGTEAFIWRQGVGMQNLRTVLINEAGLTLTGWALNSATGVSADGLTICGQGVNPSGQQEAWIARLPAPCPSDFNGDGQVNSSDLALLLANWGGAGPVGDANGDGVVNSGDLPILLGSWGPCP